MMLYKVLNGNKPIYGTGVWHLPKNGKPGKWMPPIEGELVACQNGYHLCKGPEQLIYWLGPDIYEAEGRGLQPDGDKVICRQARLLRKVEAWNERTARLFACDCAEHVLPLYEAKYPDDKRPRRAIETARLYAEGRATHEELRVAKEAARETAWATARVAAKVTREAAWVARDTAEAARLAAGDVAGDAERGWQVEMLRKVLEG